MEPNEMAKLEADMDKACYNAEEAAESKPSTQTGDTIFNAGYAAGYRDGFRTVVNRLNGRADDYYRPLRRD